MAANPRRVLYVAAHGGFGGQPVALGGGAAVCDQLLAEWAQTRPFDIELISPAILGENAPSGRDLISFDAFRYAQFCDHFRRAATAEILKHDPSRTLVLCNDVAEGPQFETLSAAGFPLVSIYHVDVVAYVTAIYGRSLLKPETAVRWYSAVRRWMPHMAGLIFDQQAQSLRYSRTVIVPSQGMRDIMHRCYPWLPADRIHVIPWGVPKEVHSDVEIQCEAARLRQEFGVPVDARVLLTLSRISPEKGQDLLLKALIEWEGRGDYPRRPLWLFVCGDAAYMQGQRFLANIQRAARRLKKTHVIFPGHVTGLRKRGFFSLADLYVFPSRHESYGLTLLEALRAGLPAVCLDHQGARSVMRPEFGELVGHSDLLDAIARLLGDDGLRYCMSEAARAFASAQPFSASANAVARLLMHF